VKEGWHHGIVNFGERLLYNLSTICHHKRALAALSRITNQTQKLSSTFLSTLS
jgi:hypothetical protein